MRARIFTGCKQTCQLHYSKEILRQHTFLFIDLIDIYTTQAIEKIDIYHYCFALSGIKPDID